MIKNLPIGEPTNLASLVAYQQGQVVSRTLTQDEASSLTLFAFPMGEGLSAHETASDALLYVLDGEAEVEIGGKQSVVGTGEAIVMPANITHAIHAGVDFKMLLAIVK